MSRPPGTVPRSIPTAVRAAVDARPEQQFLADDRHSLSYAEAGQAVDCMVSNLLALGVDPGDRVACILPNRLEIVVAFLAVQHIGAVWVGINPVLAVPEREWMLLDCSAHVVVADDTTAASIDPSRQRVLDVDHTSASSPGTVASPWEPKRAELGAIAYTSGTTGRPKAVMHDQHHMLLPGAVILQDRMNGVGERIGTHLPLTTLNVMILGPLLALQGLGSSLCTTRRRAHDLSEWIRDEDIEHLSTSPAIVHDLLDVVPARAPWMRRLRLGVGGASCPEELRVTYRSRFDRDFTTGYGLTEAPSAVVQETESVMHIAGGSGRAMAHVRVVIASDDGSPLPAGEQGEICVGPNPSGRWAGEFRGMLGYWNDPVATVNARFGDLLRTGDVGWCDQDDTLYVGDRRSDMINRGGSKVSPAEVARVLLEHPAVRDCAVIGRADVRLGETVVAIVQCELGSVADQRELLEHCSRSLARYKVPAEIVVVDSVPRNAMGKVIRREVERLMEVGA